MMPTAAAPVSAGADAATRRLLGFAATVLISALFLQRFGLPAGAKSISVVGPIGILAAGYGLAQGHLSLNPARLASFLVLSLCAVCGLIYHATNPSSFATVPSLQSLAQFMVLTSFATLSFAYSVPEQRFFRLVANILAVIAAAGVLQFVAQFAGLGLFSFRGIVPDALLYEYGYNLSIGIGFGSLLKSNGFFLLEPSIFSQFMALGLMIEILAARRGRVLVLFLAGFILSGSGTGWLVFAGFIASVAVSMGQRGLILAVVSVLVLGAVSTAIVFLAPDLAHAWTSRLGEVTQQSTSGHLRFVTPFWFLGDVLQREPIAGLVGLGAGVSETLTLPYEYDVNTPVKISMEYGFPALAAYLCTLALGRKTVLQRTLVVPGLVLLLFTGGYQQFPPVLFPVLMIISIARLDADPARGSSLLPAEQR